MLTKFKTSYYAMGAALTVGMITSSEAAHAQTGGGNNFGNIAENVTDSIANLPGLLTALSYLIGLVLGVLGILKIKDHVENPSNAPLKEGAIRLAAGGALFALPIVFEAMTNTVGDQGANATAASLNKVEFNLN